MKPRLNCVLLIDDQEADNVLHEIVIQGTGCAKDIIATQSGHDALAYLRASARNTVPDLILLDVNMPAMDGWEFLEAFCEFDRPMRARMAVVMLTTSLNPNDRKRAKAIDDVTDFIQKPLTEAQLMNVLEKHFTQDSKH